jgi:hypothetical protein
VSKNVLMMRIEPNMDNERDLYDKDLANKDMADQIIFYKSSENVMEDYFGVPLDTMVKVLDDINDVELKFKVEKCGKELHEQKV